MLTTNALSHVVTNGSVSIELDGDSFSFWGMTSQPNGDMLVHLRYADTDRPFDLEVSYLDRDELFWEI